MCGSTVTPPHPFSILISFPRAIFMGHIMGSGSLQLPGSFRAWRSLEELAGEQREGGR